MIHIIPQDTKSIRLKGFQIHLKLKGPNENGYRVYVIKNLLVYLITGVLYKICYPFRRVLDNLYKIHRHNGKVEYGVNH